ncbi:MAG: hypothetical protein Fur0046_03300 [Cyanobacteria bacterium J069]|nr:MAG: hypothetical protein D6742_04330 [Cyanobacteria bacterium J069]
MTSIKPAGRIAAPFASRVLKTAGIIVTLAALIDFFVLPIPYRLLERQWQLAFTTQFVDRGIVPLVGLGLLFAGYWIDSAAGATDERRSGRTRDLRFWALLLASLLGLIYVLLFPLHLNNVRLNNVAAQEQINQESEQAEGRLDQSLSTALQQQRAQIAQLLNASDEQIDQAVRANQINQEQANQIKDFKQNPERLEPFLQERVQELRNRGQTEIRTRKETAQATARTESIKSGLRIGLGSLVLAVGYIIIGWTGLKALD